MDELDVEVKKAPRHGLNAKALLLQAWTDAGGEEDEAERARRQQQEKRRQAAVELRAANLEVLREGPEFLAALPPKLRPMIPFVLRPRRGMPARVIRQKLLNKLAGEQLALAAHRAGGLNPAAMASEEQLWQAAVAAAVAQEAELCGRCSTQQVYQTLASRITALDWEKDSQEEQQQQQQQQPLPSQAAAAAAAAAPPAKRPRLGSPMNQGSSGAQAARTAAAAAPPAASAAGQVESRGAPATKQGHTQAPEPVHARGQLLEVDLDWEAAEEEEEEEQEVAGCSADLAIHINQPGRKGEEQQRGWGREGLDRQQQRRQHPPPSRGQAAGAAPPSREASAASSAKRAPAVRPAPSAVTDISAAPVAELRLISGSPPPGSPGAAPEGTAVGADAPGLLLGAAGVEPEVRLFVQAELEPLRRREQLTAAEYETVCARATAKVIQRHGGAADGAFLAAEGPAISKLVAKYVQKQRQQ